MTKISLNGKAVTLPRFAKDGAIELLSRASPNDIFGVIVASGNKTRLMRTRYKPHLEFSLGFKIPSERTLRYTPPRHLGEVIVGHKYTDREERVPEIKDPSKSYIIIDDNFENGGTLYCAERALTLQGVKRNNIWLYVDDITNDSNRHILECHPDLLKHPGFLDRVRAFNLFKTMANIPFKTFSSERDRIMALTEALYDNPVDEV